jgi:hypothetical protein
MTLQQAAPIGTAMLHFLGETTTTSTSEQDAAAAPTTSAQSLASKVTTSSGPSLPCLLLPGDPPMTTTSTRRILLQGPPKSGRTSLAMNLAYSCASSAICPCVDDGACRCIAVIIFRPASQQNTEFPLACHPSDQKNEPSDNFYQRYQKLNNRPLHQQQQQVIEDWEPRVLKRIQVHYVTSARELLHELLSVLGKPLSQQPSRAIVMDDLDLITAATTTTTEQQANSIISMMQTCT